MLSRSFLAPDKQSSLLSYTPMIHARLFAENANYRPTQFQPLKSAIPSPLDPYHISQLPQSDLNLDGNPALDRPLFVQFCANEPEIFLEAAKHVAPFCDAVDLNLGCPQGIAKRGHYGSFLQEDWDLIYKLINILHEKLDVPVTAKFRILETKEKTLDYARMVLSAGASIITVHGRRREQKGHNTGVADWSYIQYLRENLPSETVIFANGNILQYEDLERCLEETGADGVMSAEGNLHDPAIFAQPPPVGQEGREYWRGNDGKGGWRMDAVMRRYFDVIYKYALRTESPQRKLLALPSDPPPAQENGMSGNAEGENGTSVDGEPLKKKQKRDKPKNGKKETEPNLSAMQAHLFNLLRPLVTKHTDVRDRLARSRAGDMAAYEEVLRLVEEKVAQGLRDHENEDGTARHLDSTAKADTPVDITESSAATVEKVRRPWFICQPYVRPLPKEALEKGALSLSKKDRKRMEQERQLEQEKKDVGLPAAGRVEEVHGQNEEQEVVELPRQGAVCG
jgi:tRNA-dihydrouridine synthase 1